MCPNTHKKGLSSWSDMGTSCGTELPLKPNTQGNLGKGLEDILETHKKWFWWTGGIENEWKYRSVARKWLFREWRCLLLFKIWGRHIMETRDDDKKGKRLFLCLSRPRHTCRTDYNIIRLFGFKFHGMHVVLLQNFKVVIFEFMCKSGHEMRKWCSFELVSFYESIGWVSLTIMKCENLTLTIWIFFCRKLVKAYLPKKKEEEDFQYVITFCFCRHLFNIPSAWKKHSSSRCFFLSLDLPYYFPKWGSSIDSCY